MKTFGGAVSRVGEALVLILAIQNASAYSAFNPWSWSRSPVPGPAVPAPQEPAFNPFLRAPYQACPTTTSGVMKKVEVIPCESSERCPLIRGTNVTLDFEFVPNFPAKSVVGSLYGVMNSMLGFNIPPIKFGKPENLCVSNQVECPVEAGKLYHYRTTVFVKQIYPSLKLDTKVLIQGDDQDIACALIPVEITSK